MTVPYTRFPTSKLFQFPCLLLLQKGTFESLALTINYDVLSEPYIYILTHVTSNPNVQEFVEKQILLEFH